ncbi:ORC2-domain-containing protein [Westerdykella ornata]|uniref:ORC2-domain-containing protein n=1 Tax=Westerdykella ornata TaxID=318751 RepID=A0A6A6JC76_WESOR|nr:ORC2-domain-containing protein [Westerdykella ornata]KAF2273814.1 ORC2-domain-containing protein [Westerdykella ornata]
MPRPENSFADFRWNASTRLSSLNVPAFASGSPTGQNMLSGKRKRPAQEPEESTPRRLRSGIPQKQLDEEQSGHVHTPSKSTRALNQVEDGTPRSILKKPGTVEHRNGLTPKSNRKLLFETPTKGGEDDTPSATPTRVRNADRSARRKSTRRLLSRTINGAETDEDALEEEEILAQQILSDNEEDEEQGVLDTGVGDEDIPETPSKRGKGRPKASGKGPGRPRKPRSPTPPQDLPPHEEYFWQNRPGGTKTSNNTLPSQSLLNHDEYFQAMQTYEDRHQAETDFLLGLHCRALDQWTFELEEGFNLCLYGYGSKRPLTERLAAHLYDHLSQHGAYRRSNKTPKIVVINGYSPTTTLKEILTTIASVLVPSHSKLPNQPSSLLSYIFEQLQENAPPHPVPLIINSMDSLYLRRAPIPAMLASLAAQPCINLVCTVDTPNFPLLWDVGLKAQFKFLFHDATTFAPYDAEIDVVESVNELLGRSGRRIGGRDVVGFVLRSLPENARSLFRILVTEQLALLLMDGNLAGEKEDGVIANTPRSKSKKPASSDTVQGVEYRVLYHKAVEEFVCSSEVGFRTLLKEFHDHQMIESRKDAMGTEWCITSHCPTHTTALRAASYLLNGLCSAFDTPRTDFTSFAWPTSLVSDLESLMPIDSIVSSQMPHFIPSEVPFLNAGSENESGSPAASGENAGAQGTSTTEAAQGGNAFRTAEEGSVRSQSGGAAYAGRGRGRGRAVGGGGDLLSGFLGAGILVAVTVGGLAALP